MRKTVLFLFSATLCLLTAISCAKGPGPNDMIKLSQDEIYFPLEGGTYTITSNFEVFFDHIFVVEEDGSLKNPFENIAAMPFGGDTLEYDWIKANTVNNSGSVQITIRAQANKNTKNRTLIAVVMTVGGTAKWITIHQAGAE